MLVHRTYLELPSPASFRPAPAPPGSPARVEPLDPCPVAAWRSLYRDVGARWRWHDRDAWSDERLRAHLDRPEVRILLLRADDDADPLGFAELERHPGGDVEIVYFGLVERALGRGLGKHFLSRAVEAAWAMGATRVWLHTCTLDAPAALPNYLARGFVPFREEDYEAGDAD